MMNGNGLDHLVFTAPSRDAGAAWITGAVGAPMEIGGDHTRMGTHNALLRLGRDQYLEVIAINPAAPPPGRARWFDMDRPAVGVAPELVTWVARTADVAAACRASPVALGEIEAMSRGRFEWLVTIPPDGGLIAGGVLPNLIEWRSEHHPAGLLPERGCSLVRLEGFHPDPRTLAQVFESLGLEDAIEVRPLREDEVPYLVAHLMTPLGPVTLGAPR